MDLLQFIQPIDFPDILLQILCVYVLNIMEK